jgi:ATP-dependent RNA helicase DDX18/HAS1
VTVEEESVFQKRKDVLSDSASRASMDTGFRNEKTRSAHSLNTVLSQYRGDDELGIPSSEAPSRSKR